MERLGYDAIAARLNADLGRYPVPEPTSPAGVEVPGRGRQCGTS
jgi:hypothetical protein